MSYDWSVKELFGIAGVDPRECPVNEEFEWLYILKNAAFEAELRIENGHHLSPGPAMEKLKTWLEKRVEAMHEVAQQRGYYAAGAGAE